MKFLIDMPLSPGLAHWLRGLGHDAVHAIDLNLNRAADTEIIDCCRREARIVVTADPDYPRLLALTGASDPSLILFRGGDWSDAEVLARMKELLDGVDEADLANSVLVMERNRTRRRRLPIG